MSSCHAAYNFRTAVAPSTRHAGHADSSPSSEANNKLVCPALAFWPWSTLGRNYSWTRTRVALRGVGSPVSYTVSLPTTRNTPATKPSASVLTVVSFFCLATSCLKASLRSGTIVFSTRLLITVNQFYHIRIKLLSTQGRAITLFTVAPTTC